MYWFWYFLFAAQPAFLLLGTMGFFGKKAKKVADELVQTLGMVFLALVVLAAIVGLIYLIVEGVRVI